MLSAIDPSSVIGMFRTLPELLTSAYIPFWLIFVFPVARFFLPDVACWIAYQLKPSLIRPPLPPARRRAEPLVSVVIAGRNESASIGAAIRSTLLCGYGNLEIVFADDGSDDDSVAVARRVAESLTHCSRRPSDKVRIFTSQRRNGKASALNVGIRMARGEFIVILDADSEIQYGAIQHWLVPFADPRVGAVAANLRVRNARASLVTRFQECEYALQVTMTRLAESLVGLLTIVPGAGGMFRADIIRRLGGFDPGLGDDTDMTLKLRKQGRRVGFSVDAVVWTDVPVTWKRLVSQRTRWERNMVKIRISKHRDLFLLGRYGLANAIITVDLLIVRILLPWVSAIGIAVVIWHGPLSAPQVLTAFYWGYLTWLSIKWLIARDIARTPQPGHFWLLPAFPFYKLGLRAVTMAAVFRELLRIGVRHPYVPAHIWSENPQW
jgi:cellulose synthase/poly-beta-1,6-N-acetylglucosamine synthase-like glycosyltransferase